jgi:hypothetical protein
LIDRHPDTRFIIDHLGILQPRTPPAPPQPWVDLAKVLDLAKRENAVIKVSGACTLSQKPYPFPDIWDPLARVFDAWGFDRCLWGTDWTRAYAVVEYQQAVEPTANERWSWAARAPKHTVGHRRNVETSTLRPFDDRGHVKTGRTGYARLVAIYRKHGATSSHINCNERKTFSGGRRPPQLSSARTPLRPRLRVKSRKRIATDPGVPTITLSRSASS